MYFIIGKLYQLSSFYHTHTHTQCIIIKIDLHIAYNTLNRLTLIGAKSQKLSLITLFYHVFNCVIIRDFISTSIEI